MKASLGFCVLGAPPDPLYQMKKIRGSFHLVQKISSRATSKKGWGRPRPPKYQLGRPPGRLIGGVWGAEPPPIEKTNGTFLAVQEVPGWGQDMVASVS